VFLKAFFGEKNDSNDLHNKGTHPSVILKNEPFKTAMPIDSSQARCSTDCCKTQDLIQNTHTFSQRQLIKLPRIQRGRSNFEEQASDCRSNNAKSIQEIQESSKLEDSD
jgi:hypothetical protein